MKVSQGVIDAMYAHAREKAPEECCGLLIRVGRKLLYLPVPNAAASPQEGFRIAAEDWAGAEDQGAVIAVVHSHPGQSARLSAADRTAMEATALPWVIIEVRDGQPVTHLVHEPTGYQAPLVGRPFHHGVLDCYTLVRDYYQRELGITLPNFERADGWWEKGQDLYVDNFEGAGFYPVDPADLHQGDLIVMQVRSEKANHAGIYLADGCLKTEPSHYPVPGGILHHLYGRDSKRDVFGGFWREAARFYMRHKESPYG
ncbi:phage tail protein [Pseudomonas sp. P66]|uniref:Mov34/MPN/PAD-1 family protein n=2 Tax=Pseudomonas TaxID=286 RepID=A0AB35X075_9PSED|nr:MULTISPECIES: Mov34/MPN/PAD-1 family protein [Pseudomonas]MBM5459215.1 phage tail protein [Pseudomonas arcuscaelestis]MEE1869094.1 Mov34/MPN/PAD-1 family protein [Pseudomonas sp. 120P]MEE1959741.1 Mov34/MPN/PAD-1 family protein [Pseudomonas sp. 119P]